ncbi:ribosomal protein S6 kinase-related protein isoform X2 [Coturnix japonica]|uniref:ribosomal protein S6 kinase-related protein isoform X2 n=1 Tax=Coturnix japonica TaxID=93934 RepID=UPI0013A5DA0F|nr:ribosomal protein S6 kinase-related protein isoform X2 [Coturnix japonica]
MGGWVQHGAPVPGGGSGRGGARLCKAEINGAGRQRDGSSQQRVRPGAPPGACGGPDGAPMSPHPVSDPLTAAPGSVGPNRGLVGSGAAPPERVGPGAGSRTGTRCGHRGAAVPGVAAAAARLALPTGVPRSSLRPAAAAQDPGFGGQRFLRYHPQSVGLREREGLCGEGGCCPMAGGFHAAPPGTSPSRRSLFQVVPKVEVLRRDTLKQCKEEVSIQRQVRHPFVHGLGDSWQGQRHLFIMCPYCSTGDLHALWRDAGCFTEATVRLFAAELVLVLVYLHDLGIVHRDVKMENILLDERGHLKLADFGLSRHLGCGERAHTICGTLQYMAPEVLSGGPYSHAADWWSLGVLLFALASGEFPVPPARDHVAMLERVKESSFVSPPALSPALSRLLAELLCHNPLRRLRYLHHFQAHPFFRGVAFDAELLQKDPVPVAVAPHPNEQPLPDPATFDDFDCDFTAPLNRPWPG